VNKQLLGNVLKYLLAVVLLTWVVWSNWGEPGKHGLGDVWHRHVVEGAPVAWGFFAAAFVIYCGAVLITLLRWYLLVRAQDLPITIIQALRFGMIGMFFNAFLPGAVGGDIIKAAALARGQSRRTVAVATVIMDRVIALWGLVWFVALLGSVFWMAGALEGNAAERCKTIVALAVGAVVVSLSVWLLLGLLPQERAERFAARLERLPRIGGSAAELWRAVWLYRCRQKVVFQVLALSWVGHVGFVAAFYFAASTLWDGNPEHGIPTFTQHFLIVPIGLVVQALVPTPGGAGGGEWGFGALYKLLNCDPANGVLGSLVQRVVTWCIGLIGWAVYANLRAHQPSLSSVPTAGPEEPAEESAAGLVTAEQVTGVRPAVEALRETA
jgi:uncharacterized membrane protein YbhN (UPF0104 family)